MDRSWPVEASDEVTRAAQLLADTEITVVASGGPRTFAVPKSVQAAVQRGLRWHRLHGSDATAAGLKTAHALVAGGHVDARTVTYLSRYFSAHTTVPRGGDVPSPEHVAYSLWGGDQARRWVDKVLTANPALTAAGAEWVDMSPFADSALDEDTEFWGQFNGPRMDGVVALFARRPQDGGWLVWHNGGWESCSDPSGDMDLVYSGLCELDDDTAMYVAAALYDAPEMPVAMSEVDPAEWELMNELVFAVDTELVDSVMTSAGDNWYSPQERSANAKQQPRDIKGRFVTVGATARHSSGQQVHVDGVRPSDGAVIVSDVNGQQYVVPSRELLIESSPKRPTYKPKGPESARLPEPRPIMSAQQLQGVISDYESKVAGYAAVTSAATEYPGGANDAIKPIYFAIVAPDDPQAVMELVALAPTVDGSKVTTSFKRQGGEWVQDDAIVKDLKSPTPPPVVMLDETLFENVLAQVDATAGEPSEVEEARDRAKTQGEPVPAPITAAADKSNTVVVAVPSEDDPVWSASSEPKPHMTLLFFGSADGADMDGIHAAVADVAGRGGGPVTCPVASREPLGDDGADVVMVDPGPLAGVRDQLLENPSVRAAYDSVEQYPQWTPHVTLGYPEAPATGEPPSDVTFDRLAVWDGEYQGDEYLLGDVPSVPGDDDDTIAMSAALLAMMPQRMLKPLYGPNGEYLALVSGGIPGVADTPGDIAAAARLRRYWTVGEGRAKWDRGLRAGSWRRCVRHLSKYVGTRSRGLCAVYFHDVHGIWPGDNANRSD